MKIKEIKELIERVTKQPAKKFWINEYASIYYYIGGYFFRINKTTFKIVKKEEAIKLIKCAVFYNDHKEVVDNTIEFINKHYNDKSLLYIPTMDFWLADSPKKFLELNGYELVCKFGFENNGEKYQQLYLDTIAMFIF